MARFFERRGRRFLLIEGKPIQPTSRTPQPGDEITRGDNIYQVQPDGSKRRIQTCGGDSHLMRSRLTEEGGGKLI